MEPTEQARRWQDRFDTWFPAGCILASADPQGHTYPVPRPEVVGMRGLDPVVHFGIPSWHRSMSGIVTGWHEMQRQPCPLVKLTLDLGGSIPSQRFAEVLCSGNVSPAQARALAPDRRESLQRSARGQLFSSREDG